MSDFIEPPWLVFARTKLGIHEKPGPECDAFIAECLSLAGLPADDETAWCSCFIMRCLEECGIDYAGASAAAISWMQQGEPLLIEDAQPGDLCIFWRGATPGDWHSHVTFFIERTGNVIKCLGGNQSNSVSEAFYSAERLRGIRRIEA